MKIFIYILFFLIATVCNAQNFFNNDGLALRVDVGMTMTIDDGGLSNETHVLSATKGTIDNNGAITLTGDWENNSDNTVFSTNAGLVEFIGSTAQTIGGNYSTGFCDLHINNNFGVSPQIIIGKDIVAKNSLIMTQGNINMAGFSITLGVAPTSPGSLIHGGLASDGWMYEGDFIRYINYVTIANGSITKGMFPMGNSKSDFRPFFVSCPTIPPTTGGSITVSYTDASTTSNVNIDDNGIDVLRRHDSYWTSTMAGIVDGDFNLRIEGTGFGLVTNVDDLRITLVGNVVGSSGVNSGSNTNPQVNRLGLTDADLTNNFYLGSVTYMSPLPVSLISFDAKLEEDRVNISWVTESEINNDYFTIEKTKDGQIYEQVAIVKGAGSSNTTFYYDIKDNNPYIGVSYYRLKQTDFDGKYSYSEMKVIMLQKKGEIIVFPNPTNNIINMKFTNNIYMLDLEMYNSLGVKVYSNIFNNNNFENNILTLNVSEYLVSGIYFVKAILNETEKASTQIIVY